MSSKRETPSTLHQLREWGYDVCTSREPFLCQAKVHKPDEMTEADVAAKCLQALAFPSDYFPLRILNQLANLSQEAGCPGSATRQGSKLESQKPLLVLTARKMACLYEVLRQSGMSLSGHFDVISDRFIFLQPNLEYLTDHLVSEESASIDKKKTAIYLVDDLSRRGEQLQRRAQNFEAHLTLNENMLARCTLINLRERPVDAENFRAVGGEDGAGMIRAYSRTFARALVPYFTDFPISRTINLEREEFNSLTKWLENRSVYEVTSSVGIDEQLRCYTLDARPLITDEALRKMLDQCCSLVKLRIYMQARSELGLGYRMRIMVKPLLKDLAAIPLCGVAKRRNLLETAPTYHQLGQAFGYLEYLLSWELVEHIYRQLPTGVTRHVGESIVDEQFARIVLGEKLLAHAKRSLDSSASNEPSLIGDIQKSLVPRRRDRMLSKTAQPSAMYVLGDDIIHPIDQIVSDYTRARRDDSAPARREVRGGNFLDCNSPDWRRLGFRDLVAKANQKRQKTKSQELSDFEVGLALDILTDWGKIVPDQQAIIDESGRGKESFEAPSRLAKLDSNRQGKNVRIQRCFRAGEITASIEKTTLTGGRLSISSLSWKQLRGRGEINPERPPQPLEPWLWRKRSDIDLREHSPQVLLENLVKVVSMVPGLLRKEACFEEFRTMVKAVEKRYLGLPCPVFAMARTSTEVEFSGEILRYFSEGVPSAYSSDAMRVVGEHNALAGFGESWRERVLPSRSRARGMSLSLSSGSSVSPAFSKSSWEEKHLALKEEPSPWNFGAFRRLKRAILAVDTLLAVLQPLIRHDPDTSARILQKSGYDDGEWDVRARLSNDVWGDWVSRLSSPPAPLRFAPEQILEDNQSHLAVAIACSDLLGDLWHALTHACMALSFEISTDQPFVSHRDRLQRPVYEIWYEIKEWYRAEGFRKTLDKALVLEVSDLLAKTRDPSYSPFFETDALLTVEQVVGRRWEFRSGGLWATLGESELRHLVNSGRIIEVVDWQGGRRYPSFQFVPFCLREGLFVRKEGGLTKPGADRRSVVVPFTDEDYPFLRRDISESMRGSSLCVSGWVAALWFRSLLDQVGEEPGASGVYNPRTVGYRGFIFQEALSQKGLWISHWLADGNSLIQNFGGELFGSGEGFGEVVQPSLKIEKLYRITERSHLHPNWWSSSVMFDAAFNEIAAFSSRTVSERLTAREPYFAPGRFTPGAPRLKNGDHYGVLYLAESIKGCVLEVFDRKIAITLDDVLMHRIYEYRVDAQSGPAIRCLDLSAWPALVSATPIRSVTQAVANYMCYSRDGQLDTGYPKCIRYPLRTSLSEFGLAVFEPTFFREGGLKPAEHLDYRCGTANHDVVVSEGKALKGEDQPWLVPDMTGASLWYQGDTKASEYWRSLHSMKFSPRGSVTCLRRFPIADSFDLGSII